MPGMSPTLCNELIVLLIGFVALSTFMTPHRCCAKIRPCFSPGSRPATSNFNISDDGTAGGTLSANAVNTRAIKREK